MSVTRRPHYKVGGQFKLSADAIENYGEQYTDKIFTVRAVYDHYTPVAKMSQDATGHPGFDAAGGSPLYGSELNFDLYEWEMVHA